MMPQSCADACEDIKTHEDGEGFDAGVKTAEGFVKEGKADAEDCPCGQFGARPCILDGVDEGMDRGVYGNDFISPSVLYINSCVTTHSATFSR